MKKISILTTGKIKEGYYREAIDEYKKRLKSSIDLKIIELSFKTSSGDEKLRTMERESKKISEFLIKNKDSEVFLLSERGEEMGSVSFSKKIFNIDKPIIFVISGAFGFDFNILKDYNKISLSKMTFLHEMTQLILIEQIYRALSIEKGKRYHY
jgi:23S rRNA (pseudouridine1915-N3)-methyltransferase